MRNILFNFFEMLFIFSFIIYVASCGKRKDIVTQLGLNRKLYEEATVVVRAKLLFSDSSCDKYCWQTVRPLTIIKGPDLNKTIRVAHYSFEQGLPQGNSIVYLRPYLKDIKDSLWTMTGFKFLTALTVD